MCVAILRFDSMRMKPGQGVGSSGISRLRVVQESGICFSYWTAVSFRSRCAIDDLERLVIIFEAGA